MLGILGSLVGAIGFMLKQVYLAWSVGIGVALLQLIWFPTEPLQVLFSYHSFCL